MNIQQQTTSEVANREIVMSENAEKDTPPPQAIYNVFSEAELLSQSTIYFLSSGSFGRNGAGVNIIQQTTL